MNILILAFFIGIIAGLRVLTAPTVASWAARLGWIDLSNTHLAFPGFAYTPYILSLLAWDRSRTTSAPEPPAARFLPSSSPASSWEPSLAPHSASRTSPSSAA